MFDGEGFPDLVVFHDIDDICVGIATMQDHVWLGLHESDWEHERVTAFDPEQARQVGQALLDAASRVEAG